MNIEHPKIKFGKTGVLIINLVHQILQVGGI